MAFSRGGNGGGKGKRRRREMREREAGGNGYVEVRQGVMCETCTTTAQPESFGGADIARRAAQILQEEQEHETEF